jgi:hypothetical protein
MKLSLAMTTSLGLWLTGSAAHAEGAQNLPEGITRWVGLQ